MYKVIPNHHPAVLDLVTYLQNKTQNTDEQFFLATIAYYLSKIASSQRTVVKTKERGDIPVNQYVIATASSGYGKNFTTNLLEGVVQGFKDKFVTETMPMLAETNMRLLADERAAAAGSDPETEFTTLWNNYERSGEYLFTFDSGTAPALKQLRSKILLSKVGAVNFSVDEIGSNLLHSTELLNVYLELYDKGLVNPKLVKNTNDNIRDIEVKGFTPANMLLFGTPAKIFDGSHVENMFMSFLETGYARRCLFGVGNSPKNKPTITAAELYQQLISPAISDIKDKWSAIFTELADSTHSNWNVDLNDKEAINLLQYRMWCDDRADRMNDFDEIQKAEMKHRYFKVLKLAGAYAFIDSKLQIDQETLDQAIYLVEELSVSFKQILAREPAYARLARYISDVDVELTHADLNEALPFYSTGKGAREEMMAMATAWGYKHSILIKRQYVEGIEFFTGYTLAKTDLDKIILSYSEGDWSKGYINEEVPFTELHTLCTQDQFRWLGNHLIGGQRSTETTQEGTNVVVLDIDGTAPLSLVMDLLKEYTYFIHTTKSHTEESNCYRVVLPLNYVVKLDPDEYREFIDNIRKWLPFEVDPNSNKIAQVWTTYTGCDYYYNEGELVEAIKFVPKTKRNEQFISEQKEIKDMGALERWFAQRISEGNRNDNMLKFALALVTSGLGLAEIKKRVFSFNKSLPNPLEVVEIDTTIMRTVANKIGGTI